MFLVVVGTVRGIIGREVCMAGEVAIQKNVSCDSGADGFPGVEHGASPYD